MTKEEIKEYVKNCPYSDNSIDTMHTCALEFHYRKVCPSSECLCAEKFGLKRPQEWIPCNPLELPKDKKLWVTHDRWGCRYVGDVFWDMTEWSDNVSDVVAYMPYMEPEPYREDEK